MITYHGDRGDTIEPAQGHRLDIQMVNLNTDDIVQVESGSGFGEGIDFAPRSYRTNTIERTLREVINPIVGQFAQWISFASPSSSATSIYRLPEYASVPLHDAFLKLGSQPSGLSDADASDLLSIHGENSTVAEKSFSSASLFFSALANPFNVLLSVLAVITIATNDKADFSVMVLMISISTGLRFVQEKKSMVAASKLITMLSSKVIVSRHEGVTGHASATRLLEVERRNVVPGDVVQ
jgi:magnesium-transporting ATPase (P-type)